MATSIRYPDIWRRELRRGHGARSGSALNRLAQTRAQAPAPPEGLGD